MVSVLCLTIEPQPYFFFKIYLLVMYTTFCSHVFSGAEEGTRSYVLAGS